MILIKLYIQKFTDWQMKALGHFLAYKTSSIKMCTVFRNDCEVQGTYCIVLHD